jgi:Family of unknown function (DUF5677)
MDAETHKAVEFADKLLQVAIDVLAAGAASVKMDDTSVRDPKVVAFALLCRSISNFRAAILLAKDRQVMEARALVRCLFENVLWMGALLARGPNFVQDMMKDEAFNSTALRELALKMSGKHRFDLANNASLRSSLRALAKQFPNSKKLSAKTTAAAGRVEMAYLAYANLSLDAVHCSVSALARHLSPISLVDGTVQLTVSVEANTRPGELLETIQLACRALIVVGLDVSALIGVTGVSVQLQALFNELEQSGWASAKAHTSPKDK